jgi:hypothetical protein
LTESRLRITSSTVVPPERNVLSMQPVHSWSWSHTTLGLVSALSWSAICSAVTGAEWAVSVAWLPSANTAASPPQNFRKSRLLTPARARFSPRVGSCHPFGS